MWNDVLVGLASGIIILVGAIGSILPILPGPPLSFVGLWVYAWYTNYETITPTVLIVFGVLTLLTVLVDIFAPALGAKGYKASGWGVWGSMIGAFVGIFVLGPLGIILGPFLGAFIGEIMFTKDINLATKSAAGAFIGFVVGSVFKVSVIVGMFVYLIYALVQ